MHITRYCANANYRALGRRSSAAQIAPTSFGQINGPV
jgi:hypothetical protein